MNLILRTGKFFTFYLLLSTVLLSGCSKNQGKNAMMIGFGKANLSPAGIYEDPASADNTLVAGEKYKREEKFAISDRVAGRWRPGSGITRKIVDSIFVSAMYGEDENGPWAIVTLDATDLFFEDIDLVESPLTSKLGIPKERIVILPSHSHATPPLEPEKFQEVVLDAVSQAKANRSEVEVAALSLKLDGKKYVMNRRVFVEGIGSRTVMFNDGCVIHDNYADVTEHIHDWVKNLGVDPEKFLEAGKEYDTNGDVDNNLQALFIRDKKTGEIKGSFLRFAAHAVIVSAKVVNGDVSADWPGYMKRKIETSLGGIALFGQGPCGDLRPLNKEYSHAFARQYGETLAGLLIAKFNNLTWESLSELGFYTQPVELSLLGNIFYSKDELKTEMDKVEDLYDKEKDPMKKRELQNKFWGLYRIPTVNKIVRPEWKDKKEVPAHVYGLRFNDHVIVAIQGEIFTEIGKEMVEPYDEKKPILVSIANEYISYIPTDKQRLTGGYEPSVSIVQPGSPAKLIQAVHQLLDRIYEN